MGLQEEVPVADVGDAAVDNSTFLAALGRRMGVARIGRVEPGMVTLNRYNEGDARLRAVGVRELASLADERQLNLQDSSELALGDAVAEDDNVLRQGVLVGSLPQLETRPEVDGQLLAEHLSSGGVVPRDGGPLG